MRLLFTLAALALTSTPAFAQTSGPVDVPPNPPATVPDRVTIGVGAVNTPDYEGSADNFWTPGAVVVGTLGGYDFFTRGKQLYVDLARDRPGVGSNLELGVIAGVRNDRTGDLRNETVDALGNIDWAYEAGGFVGFSRTGVITSDYDTLTARIAFVHDVAGTYDSYVVTPQINYTTPLSRATLVSASVSADYVGKGYGRTYFGVTPAGALASGLPVYDVDDAGWSRFNLSFFAVQSLTGDLTRGLGIGAGVLYGRLLGNYRDSPVVRGQGDADQWNYAVGLTYTF